MNRTAKLATFLTLLASSEAFAPTARVQRQNVALSATSDENDGWKKMAGGAAGFLTGLGFMAQVAFADPSSITSVEHGKIAVIVANAVLILNYASINIMCSHYLQSNVLYKQFPLPRWNHHPSSFQQEHQPLVAERRSKHLTSPFPVMIKL